MDDEIRRLEHEAAVLERELAAVERELELAHFHAMEERDREQELDEQFSEWANGDDDMDGWGD